MEICLNAALVLAELQHGAHEVGGHEGRDRIDGFADFLDLVDGRKRRGVFNLNHFAVGEEHLIDDGRRRRDEVHVVFALETLLDDVHVKEPEEPRAEAEAESLRALGLKAQRRVVQLELRERVAKRIVLVRLNRRSD